MIEIGPELAKLLGFMIACATMCGVVWIWLGPSRS